MVKPAAEYLKDVDSSSLGARTAVLVGGTSGIGAKVAELLSEYGVGRIIIIGRNAQRGAATVENIRHRAPAGGEVRAEYIRGDVS
jgi:NAD(P)-dependent dehydrogenase (short-subunit alcohol dehydrogenase family)